MNRLERESCSAKASTIPAFHLHCTKIESEGNYFASLPLTFIGCRSTYCFNLLSYFSVNAKIINIIIFDDCFFHCAFKYKVVLFQYFSGGNIRFVYQPCDSMMSNFSKAVSQICLTASVMIPFEYSSGNK